MSRFNRLSPLICQAFRRSIRSPTGRIPPRSHLDINASRRGGRCGFRGRRNFGKCQSDLRQRRNTGHLRHRQRNRLWPATPFHLLRHIRCRADAPLDEVPQEPNPAGSVDIDDLAQFVHVALHRPDGLHDPDLRRCQSREVPDQRQRRQCLGLGACADDVAHEGNVVELTSQP